MRTRDWLSRTALCGVLTLLAGQAQAQDAGQATLEEIVVTAQKRAQDLQDVSIAVTAMSGEALQRAGVHSTEDLQNLVAGLQEYNYAGKGHPQFFVRGIGSADFAQNTPPATPVYIDEVYMASNVVSGLQLFDLEGLEVLKGPQGTLFGRNTVGGAISYRSRLPSQEASGYALLSAGSFETVGGEAAFGGPLSETVSFRVAGKFGIQNKGYFRNSYPGSVTSVDGLRSPITGASLFDPKSRGGASRDLALRGALRFEPSDDLTIVLSANYGKIEGDAYPLRAVGFLGAGCPIPLAGGVPIPSSPAQSDPARCFDVLGYSNKDGKRDFQNDFIGKQDQSGGGGLLRIEWGVSPDVELTSITAYGSGSQSLGTDTDGSPNFQLSKVRYYDVESISQELRVASRTTEPVFWMAGAYASFDTISLLDDTALTTEADLIGNGTLPLTNLLHPLLGPFGNPTGDYARASGAAVENDQETFTWALFGQAEWRFARDWRLTVGARYTTIEVDFDSRTDWLFPERTVGGAPIPAGLRRIAADIDGTGPGIVDESRTFRSVSGKLALDWKPTDDILLYASASRGFRGGGFEGNFVLSAVNAVPYDKETLDAFEVGWKTEWLERTLRFNGAAFYYDYSDVQQRATGVSPVTNAPANFIQNIGDAEQWGVDADVQWLPTRGLTLTGSVAYVHQDLKPDAGVTVGGRFPFASEWSGTLGARYDWTVGGLAASVQADAKYTGDYFTTAENHRFLEQDAYTTVGARASLADPDGRWELAVWGANLGNEAFITQAYSLFGSYMVGYSRPRTYGVTLKGTW